MRKPKQKATAAKCAAVAQSPGAGLLLFSLLYWTPKKEFSGKLWMAKPYSQLTAETGMTVKQCKYAMSKLKQLGFVETSQHLFHGKNVLHLRVTDTAKEAVYGATGVTQNRATQATQNRAAQVTQNSGTSYTTYRHRHTPLTYTKDLGEHSLAGKSEHDMKKSLTIEEAIAKAKGKTIAAKPGTITHLDILWRQEFTRKYGTMAASLTMKQRGQLKKIMTQVGEDRAPELVKCVIREWIAFTKACEDKAGVKTTPAQPHIGFLLSNATTAIGFAFPKKIEPVEQNPVAESPPKKVKLISQVEDPDDEEAPASLSELLGIINGGAKEGG